jgi:hypothetical protein
MVPITEIQRYITTRLDPIPWPSTVDDITNGLNFSLPPNVSKVVHTFLDDAFIIIDLVNSIGYGDNFRYY